MAGSPREERAWIRRAQNGSVADFEALFRDHWPRAYRAAYLVVHDAAAAEDIAQESFLAAVRTLERFDRRRPFGPWLHRIVVNRAIDWTRARALRREVGEAALASVAAIAVALAIAAAALSPPGMAVLGSLRDAVRGEPNAKPALFSLPTGRLLVESDRGVWVVQRDGSKRLLRGYHDASWSPHGIYIAAIHGHELRALEPNGNVHWSLARPGRLATPRWSFEGYRVAYRAGD